MGALAYKVDRGLWLSGPWLRQAQQGAGTSELKQMWIDEAYRGRGYARELLNAFAAEAAARCVRRIWVQSHDFQAPGMYEKAGFVRVAEFADWPEGHSNVVLCKILEAAPGTS